MSGIDLWSRFWFAPLPAARLAWFRVLAGWLMLYDAHIYNPRHFATFAEQHPEATWRPLYLFELLDVGPPSVALADAIHAVQLAAIFCATIGVLPRTSWLITALLAFWSGGMVYSFTKVRHDRVALFFASLALAFSRCDGPPSVADLWRRRLGSPSPALVSGWPLRLTQVTLAIGYGAAGLAKLTTPGWSNGFTLQGIMLGHRGAWSETVASSVGLCQGMSLVTIAVETGIPALLVWPRLGWVLLPGALLFHLATWATLDTGPYMTLWFLLIAFVPLERAWSWWHTALSRRRGAAAMAALLATCWLGVVCWVIWAWTPPGQSLALAALSLGLLAAYARRQQPGGDPGAARH